VVAEIVVARRHIQTQYVEKLFHTARLATPRPVRLDSNQALPESGLNPAIHLV
jgi:hypothetical protein